MNTQFISYIYSKIVRKAGQKAASNRHFSTPNDLCMVNYESVVEGRLRAVCDKDEAIKAVGKIGYDPDDITVVGGAALNLYSSMLNARFSIPLPPSNVSTYQKYMETDDIDMVWWPHADRSLESGHTILSKGLRDFCQDFVNEINENLRNNYREIKGFVEYALQRSVTLELNCTLSDYLELGVNTATIVFKINGTHHKLAEIMIHDGFSSQRNDYEGRAIGRLEPMYQDVSYVSKYAYFKIDRPFFSTTDGVMLPRFEKFIEHQFFLLANTLRERPEFVRVMKAWGRVYYLDSIFGNILYQSEQRGSRANVVIDGFMNVNELMNLFDMASNTLRNVYTKEIAELCGDLPEGRLFHKSVHSFCVIPTIPASIPRDSPLYTRIRDMSMHHRGMVRAAIEEADAEMGLGRGGGGGGTRRRFRASRRTRRGRRY